MAGKRAGGFSLGMTQRLGIAAALLGDPPVLLLDEPVNGLDPDGVAWNRGLLRSLAAEGRTVFVSSHLMSEMEHTADHLIVIGRGQLIAGTSLEEFTRRAADGWVEVRSPQASRLARLISEHGGTAGTSRGGLAVRGLSAAGIGDLAAAHGIASAEWTKLRTLRSSYWTLLAAAIAMTGFRALLCAAYARHLTLASRAALDPAAYNESGFFLAQLAIGVLGVLTMTGEYATGSIRSTLAAAPRRVTVAAAKAAVFTAVAFGTGLAASLAAFLLGQAIFAGKGIQVSLSAAGTLRPVFGAALYLAVFGLLSLGLGALIRRAAGAVAVLIALLIFLPASVGALPAAWRNDVNPYLPSVAGQAVIGTTKFTPPGHLLSAWTGFAVFFGYAAAVLVAAAITLRRRDA